MTEIKNEHSLKSFGDFIQKRFAKQDILEVQTTFSELSVTILRSVLIKLILFLKDDHTCRFDQLVDITCVDTQEIENRFIVVYHLLSPLHNRRIRIKLKTDEEWAIPSVSKIYPSASWCEREVWDMFGISFADHPDLRRLLSADDIHGSPLRKNFKKA